ncbi:MAG: glutamate ABC transporter substrate-binding protein [Bifidobacteriaceae bacterium]|jgi:glutamate transport system substrate-binding protein|nr:glutamate ABC transporter substrate-binding protein [Bifidobacteriaceae bacterium]MCI1978407.1 glutamate ABC transporter substrate-binding protein [Bifidobacteriaceae bacterium]
MKLKFKVAAQSVAAFAAAGALLFTAACGSTQNSSTSSSSNNSSTDSSSLDLDTAAFDKLVAGGEKADDSTVAASEWATSVKKAGVFKIGGTKTSNLFSQQNEKDGKIRGFDAGIAQLLAQYILGDPSKVEVVQVDSSTREKVIQNKQVSATIATYSITPERKKVISFAGPYYTSHQGVLVSSSNSDITGVDSLAGKKVATQAGSTGPDVLKKYAPKATVQEFQTHQEAVDALKQGRVDAYVTDYTLLLNAVNQDSKNVKIAGKEFGDADPYGIGLPKDSDGVAFVNAFLKKIEDDGTWKQLWQLTIGDRTNNTDVPTPPEITEK